MEPKYKDLYRVVGTVIIYRPDGKFLITKRSATRKVFPGKWTVPGGGLEENDYKDSKPTSFGQWYGVLDKALRREIKEEVNLEIGKMDYLLDLVFVRPDGIPVVTLSFYAPFISGEVVLNDESSNFAWIKASEAKKYDLIEGIDDEIAQVDKLLRTRSA